MMDLRYFMLLPMSSRPFGTGVIVFNYQPFHAYLLCGADNLADIALALAESLGSVAYSVLDMELSYPVAVFGDELVVILAGN